MKYIYDGDVLFLADTLPNVSLNSVVFCYLLSTATTFKGTETAVCHHLVHGVKLAGAVLFGTLNWLTKGSHIFKKAV